MKKINKQELHTIFIGIKNNNELEFNKLYERYNKIVYGIAFSILKNKEDSEEIVQIVFMKISKLEKEKLPNKYEASWLYTFTKNETISLLRQKKEEIDIEKIYEIKDNNNQLDEIVDKIQYNQLIRKLSNIEKEIVSLKILSGYSFNEIAKMLKKPVGTIKWKYYKAINTLEILISNLAMFIITFIIGIKAINIGRKKSQENIEEKPKQDENIKEDNEQKDIDNKKENQETSENLREDTKNEINQEVIQENPQVNNYSKYFGIGLLSVSAIFLSLTIIFSIFLLKYKLKYHYKTSK